MRKPTPQEAAFLLAVMEGNGTFNHFKSKVVKSCVAFLFSGCLCNTPVEGEKIGMIVKVADEGIIWTTHEGQLIRGGFSGGSGVNGTAFHFTLTNNADKKKAEDALEHQQEVVIKYHLPGFAGCGSRSAYSEGIVDSIEVHSTNPDKQ